MPDQPPVVSVVDVGVACPSARGNFRALSGAGVACGAVWAGGLGRFRRVPPRDWRCICAGIAPRWTCRWRTINDILVANIRPGPEPGLVAVATSRGVRLARSVALATGPGDAAVMLLRGTWHAGPLLEGPEARFFALELSDTNVADHWSCDLAARHGVALTLVA